MQKSDYDSISQGLLKEIPLPDHDVNWCARFLSQLAIEKRATNAVLLKTVHDQGKQIAELKKLLEERKVKVVKENSNDG